ncbi:EAL domain-containing protein [Marinomonas rhizomae]|uniref:cyclic-guanylate-specific phosphodiesterase n=1 Tax=Marinomonas rhizomae TaxID=491948 RepID=A0A366J694_9GAMM|nr:EAL domain-containing protein [Marinomonas rhizomae]RBP82551.1 periplasmic sensor diguanylate cyclase/phosphodiesterase [Marinomonas rhizomae]RNF73663.1 EAL domain-containing protein [Marinomonas rhizomae]
MKKAEFRQPSALFFSLIAFFAITVFGGYWTQSNNESIVSQHQSLLGGISRTQASVLERRLSSAFTSAQILAYEVEQNNGYGEWFSNYADKLIKSIGGIENLQLAPDGIISDIYPLKGNEAAIGFDIISTPRFKDEAMLSIKHHKMFVIGPVALVQGGVAVISRAPVFLNRGTQRELFWGFASAVIYLDNLLEATQLKQLEQEGYQYSLSRKHAATKETIVLSSSITPLSDIQVSTNLILPVGTWTLRISRALDAQLKHRKITGYVISITVAFLLSIALYAILIQPLKLRTLVKEKTAELQELAYKDPLTGLPNRRFLQDSLPKTLYDNQKRKRISAFIYFDLDNFKRINDTIGHDVGDQVLVIVGDRLNKLKHVSDLVVRLGGDEFGILLGDISNEKQAAKQANQVLESIRAPIKMDNKEYILSTSLGIAMIPEHGYDLVTIMQNADMALYQAKLMGKNQYIFYTETMKISTHNLIKAEDDLSLALQRNEFEMYYQPQFDLHTDHVFGAEALIRWNHPEKGLVFPNDFISLAESTGKIVQLGYWVLESSIAYLAKRKDEGRPDILLHINLASEQLSDPHFVTLVKELLEKYQVPAHLIGFEITETSILEDIHLARYLLQTLKEMGICIAIDDFGTGYSSLSQLKNLPVDLLKIDRSFVMDLENDPDDRKIVEAIIAMAHKLNIKVLAEGIETREQWKMLAEFQCDFGQGYYVSKAVTADEFNQGTSVIHQD